MIHSPTIAEIRSAKLLTGIHYTNAITLPIKEHDKNIRERFCMLHLSAECIGVIFDENVLVVSFRYGMLHSSRISSTKLFLS